MTFKNILDVSCLTACNIEIWSASWPCISARQQTVSSACNSNTLQYISIEPTHGKTLAENNSFSPQTMIRGHNTTIKPHTRWRHHIWAPVSFFLPIPLQQTDQTKPSVTSSHMCLCRPFFRSRPVSTVVINHRLGHKPSSSGQLGWTDILWNKYSNLLYRCDIFLSDVPHILIQW